MSDNDKFIVKSPYGSTVVPDISMAEFMTKRFSQQQLQQQIAVIDATDKGNGLQLTYKTLEERIKQKAALFLSIGLDKNDFVIMFADNSLDYLISILALIYLGIKFTSIPSTSGYFEFIEQIQDSQTTVLWIDGEHLSIFKKVINNQLKSIGKLRLMIISEDSSDDYSSISNNEQCPIKNIVHMKKLTLTTSTSLLKRIPYFQCTPDDHLVIVYTSGSTGMPKGAIHTHKTILTSTLIFRPPFKIVRYLSWYPFAHISGILAALKNLCWGQTFVLTNNNRLNNLFMCVEKYQINHLPIASNHAKNLADYHSDQYQLKFNLKSLKIISSAGSKISAEILKKIENKFQVNVYNLYGSTEMLGSVTIPLDRKQLPTETAGILQTNNEMKIIDIKTKQHLPPFQHGEICFRGPARFIGYLNNVEATNQTIDSNGWYHTGDIGYYDNDGFLFVVDRIKLMIKFREWSLSPVQIESYLQRHPAIQLVCVVGVKHSSQGHLIRAYVQLKKDHHLSEDDIFEFTKQNMSVAKQLYGGVRFVQQIKCTPLGKIDRQYYNRLIQGELIID